MYLLRDIKYAKLRSDFQAF